MLSKGNYSRIDLAGLKALIYQKIGHKRAELYFNLLNRLFSSKISKSEFDKLCTRVVGREHISLHNRFIRSIIKNASLSKVPPPKDKNPNNPQNVKLPSSYQKNCLQSLYCDGFPPSPRKVRSVISRDLKFRDRPSPLGPLGKTRSSTLDQSPTELNSLGSRPPVASVEDGEEVEQITASPCVQSKTPVTAPLGVSFGGPTFNRSANKFHSKTCQSSGELPDTRSLRSWLAEKLERDGLGISPDCVTLMNDGLDVFLKRLIEPCMGLAHSRQGLNEKRRVPSVCMSMLDFRVAVESNPRILGEDWAIQLEKVSCRVYE